MLSIAPAMALDVTAPIDRHAPTPGTKQPSRGPIGGMAGLWSWRGGRARGGGSALAAAAVVALGVLAPHAAADIDEIFPFVVTEHNLIRGEAEGVFGFTNTGDAGQIITPYDSLQYNYFLTPGVTVIPGQPTLFNVGTHERVFAVPLSASSSNPPYITWVMVEGTNEATTGDPALANSVVRPFEGQDTYTHSATSAALPTDWLVVRDGGRLNVTAGLTVDTLNLLNDGVANLLDGELTVASSLNVQPGGTLNSQANVSTNTLSVQGGGVVNLLGGELTVATFLSVSDGGEIRALGGTLNTSLANVDAGGRLVLFGGEHDLGFGVDNAGETVFTDTTIHGNINNKAGSATNIVGDVTFTGDVSGPGSFFGSGTATFTGSFSPGASPAEVDVEGSLAFDDTNTLEIELAGILDGEFDALLVQGDVSLDGMLDVSLLAGFAPLVGQQFEILDVGGSLSGQFTGLDEGAVAGTFGATDLRISYLGGDGNDVVLTVVPEPTSLALLALGGFMMRGRHRRAST